MCSRAFETRSRPPLSRRYPRALPSMSLFPTAPFDLSVLPIYVARVPAAPFTRSCPRHLYVDHSHCLVLAPATLAALPSIRVIETRSLPTSLAATHHGFAFYVAFPQKLHSRSRRVLCCSSHSLHSGDVMANEAGAIVRCASTVGDRGHKENAIAVIRVAIRDSRIATFANKL